VAAVAAGFFVEMGRWSTTQPVTTTRRWKRADASAAERNDAAMHVATLHAPSIPPPPVAMHGEEKVHRQQRAASCKSFIVQHYHSTGCVGGAFSYRAAIMDPAKDLFLCQQPREYRATTLRDIHVSREDKRRGGGPRVGPFQPSIPGQYWEALPKYDFTTKNRSCAFNERMHVEWENHVDHILKNGGDLPTASVVAKAGFRSCAPCCRDMLALAQPTGKTFIMVDCAEDDERGTFHFVTGEKYLPVPKEDCNPDEVVALKKLVADAQDGRYSSSQAIHDAVLDLEVPIDVHGQALYLGDRALLPPNCAIGLRGTALLEVLHAEHFARLLAEYGASILRDTAQPPSQQETVRHCRARAARALVTAWRPHLVGLGIDLESYAAAAVAPLLSEEPVEYERAKRRRAVRRADPHAASSITTVGLQVVDEDYAGVPAFNAWTTLGAETCQHKESSDDNVSLADASTVVPDDAMSSSDSMDA